MNESIAVQALYIMSRMLSLSPRLTARSFSHSTGRWDVLPSGSDDVRDALMVILLRYFALLLKLHDVGQDVTRLKRDEQIVNHPYNSIIIINML